MHCYLLAELNRHIPGGDGRRPLQDAPDVLRADVLDGDVVLYAEGRLRLLAEFSLRNLHGRV